jgi:hypothetical protein
MCPVPAYEGTHNKWDHHLNIQILGSLVLIHRAEVHGWCQLTGKQVSRVAHHIRLKRKKKMRKCACVLVLGNVLFKFKTFLLLFWFCPQRTALKWGGWEIGLEKKPILKA